MLYYIATVGENDVGSINVSGGSTGQHSISSRSRHEYIIKIVAVSPQLPSTVVEETTINGVFWGWCHDIVIDH